LMAKGWKYKIDWAIKWLTKKGGKGVLVGSICKRRGTQAKQMAAHLGLSLATWLRVAVEQLKVRKSRQRSNGWQQGRASHQLMLPRQGPLRLLTATGSERQREKRSIEQSDSVTQVERNVRARRPTLVTTVRRERQPCEQEETLDDVLARREVWKRLQADKAAADSAILRTQGDEHARAHARAADLREIGDDELEAHWQALDVAAIRGLLGLHTQEERIQNSSLNYLVKRSTAGICGLGDAKRNTMTDNYPEGTESTVGTRGKAREKVNTSEDILIRTKSTLESGREAAADVEVMDLTGISRLRDRENSTVQKDQQQDGKRTEDVSKRRTREADEPGPKHAAAGPAPIQGTDGPGLKRRQGQAWAEGTDNRGSGEGEELSSRGRSVQSNATEHARETDDSKRLALEQSGRHAAAACGVSNGAAPSDGPLEDLRGQTVLARGAPVIRDGVGQPVTGCPPRGAQEEQGRTHPEDELRDLGRGLQYCEKPAKREEASKHIEGLPVGVGGDQGSAGGWTRRGRQSQWRLDERRVVGQGAGGHGRHHAGHKPAERPEKASTRLARGNGQGRGRDHVPDELVRGMARKDSTGGREIWHTGDSSGQGAVETGRAQAEYTFGLANDIASVVETTGGKHAGTESRAASMGLWRSPMHDTGEKRQLEQAHVGSRGGNVQQLQDHERQKERQTSAPRRDQERGRGTELRQTECSDALDVQLRPEPELGHREPARPAEEARVHGTVRAAEGGPGLLQVLGQAGEESRLRVAEAFADLDKQARGREVESARRGRRAAMQEGVQLRILESQGARHTSGLETQREHRGAYRDGPAPGRHARAAQVRVPESFVQGLAGVGCSAHTLKYGKTREETDVCLERTAAHAAAGKREDFGGGSTGNRRLEEGRNDKGIRKKGGVGGSAQGGGHRVAFKEGEADEEVQGGGKRVREGDVCRRGQERVVESRARKSRALMEATHLEEEASAWDVT
jgi:hypothetical protein